MSATLLARGLAAAYGDKALFAGLDLVVAPGDVVGLVGVNGAGKSTLLRLLAGLDTPEAGRVSLSPPDGTRRLPAAGGGATDGETVAEHVARRTGVAAAEHAMDDSADALADGHGRCGRDTTRSPWSAGSRSAGPTSPNAPAPCWPISDSPSIPRCR